MASARVRGRSIRQGKKIVAPKARSSKPEATPGETPELLFNMPGCRLWSREMSRRPLGQVPAEHPPGVFEAHLTHHAGFKPRVHHALGAARVPSLTEAL